MEKQYSTHFLSEKYKQHWLIDIYNFEITILKNHRNTVHHASNENRRVMEAFTNVQFFLPQHVFPAAKVAWQNGPSLSFTEQ